MGQYKLQLVEKPNLDLINLEPLMDMAFAADLCGMTYKQLVDFLRRHKWRFPARYRLATYWDTGGYRRRIRVRVLYPFEIKLVREIWLRGPGSRIHNRTDLALYLASEEGQDVHERVRERTLSKRAAKARATGASGVHSGGAAPFAGGDTRTVESSPPSQEDHDSLVQRGTDQESTYD